MIEQDVIVTTKYGKCPSFAVCPDGPGQYPGIIFYMDAPGTREELRNMARRIAKHGYFCLLPDMYYRLGHLRFDVHRRDDAMFACIRGAMNSLTNAMVMDDTGGWIGWLNSQDKCKPGPMGCVGYCMSGMHVTNAAALYPHRIASAASLYGVGIITDKEELAAPAPRPGQGRTLLRLRRDRPQRAGAHPGRSREAAQEARHQARVEGVPGHRARLRLHGAGDLQHARRRGDVGQDV